MNGTDVHVGDPLPTLTHVEKADGPFSLLLRWKSGRRKGHDIVDVAPQIFAFKIYKPLHEDAELFSQVSVTEDGSAVVWPGNGDLEISADALEELAEDTMTSDGFGRFLRDMNWTFEAAAAQLGISRRLVAYYAKEREIPRYIGLACEALRQRASHEQPAVRQAIDATSTMS